MRRIMRELNELQTSPPEGIRVVNNEDNMLDVTGIIKGPGMSILMILHFILGSKRRVPRPIDGTPYAGGYFRVKFKFTEEFPAAPPKCMKICINIL